MLRQVKFSMDHMKQTLVNYLVLIFDNAYNTLVQGQIYGHFLLYGILILDLEFVKDSIKTMFQCYFIVFFIFPFTSFFLGFFDLLLFSFDIPSSSLDNQRFFLLNILKDLVQQLWDAFLSDHIYNLFFLFWIFSVDQFDLQQIIFAFFANFKLYLVKIN